MLATAPTTAIRLGLPRDRAAIVRLLARVAAESPYLVGEPFHAEHVNATVSDWLCRDRIGFFLAAEDDTLAGLLVLVVSPHLVSGRLMASQACWWVEPSHRRGLGLQLLAAGEAWARDMGADRIEMLAPARKFSAWFARHGYVPTAQTWERRF